MVFLGLGVNKNLQLLANYKRLKEVAEKSNKTSQESLDRLESLKKKFDTRLNKLK